MKPIIIAFVLLLLCATVADAQVAIIANRSVPETSLTPAQVLDLYMLNTRAWSDGQVVELMCLRENPVEERKFFALLRRTPLEMRKVWLRAQLSGQARPPEMITTQEDMARRVATTPGAVGVIARDKVQGNVKILLVIE
jgi:hypothetical protein